jgi:hypothetical protein
MVLFARSGAAHQANDVQPNCAVAIILRRPACAECDDRHNGKPPTPDTSGTSLERPALATVQLAAGCALGALVRDQAMDETFRCIRCSPDAERIDLRAVQAGPSTLLPWRGATERIVRMASRARRRA